MVHKYWTTLNHFCIPNFHYIHSHFPKNVNITFSGNTDTPEIFQYQTIFECPRFGEYLNKLGRFRIWDVNYTFSEGSINPNLPAPVNFVPFGTRTYSLFDINLMSITFIKFVYLYFCLFLNKA